MKSLLTATVATAVLLVAGSTAFGQGYVTMMPVQPAPVVAYYPYVGPPVVGPFVQVQPRYYVASPIVAPAPVYASPYVVAGPPVYYGPRVWVHPKVYVAGEPVRNVIRAVTP
ncbi:MAG: hypothetical protein ABR915_03950 [Thermoguttaceae bacterium]